MHTAELEIRGGRTAGAPAGTVPDLADLKRQVVAHWSSKAKSFDQGDSCVTRTCDITEEWARIFTNAFGPAPRDVLDVGAGTGELSVLFHSLGYRAHGIDLAPGMLEVAREKIRSRGLPIVIERGDAEAPPFPDARFDVVHARHVVQLLPDPERALREWVRILRPGGVVFITATYDDGRPDTLREKVQHVVGRMFLRVFHALGIDRNPVSPPKVKEPYQEHMPLRRRLDEDGMRAYLTAGGLVDVEVRDLLALRLRGRDAMVWYRRWANRPKRSYHAAWGRKPEAPPRA